MLEMELSVQDSQGQSRSPVEMKHRDCETQGVLRDLSDSYTQADFWIGGNWGLGACLGIEAWYAVLDKREF